jgi:uncharacterized protein (TIGR03067 family)
MKLFASLCALALAVSPALADEKKADFDASKLEGKWKITAGEKFGEKVDPKSIEGEVTITKDTIIIKGNDMTHMMKFTLDTKASPVAISMEGTEGPAKGFKSEGIIEVKGDEVKLCYAMPEEKRPTTFGTKKGDKNLFFVMKRAK